MMSELIQTFFYKDLVCNFDTLQLEESISSQYANMLLSGRSIMIPFSTFDNTLQHLSVTTGSQTMNIAKNFTRLDTVLASLAQEEPATASANLAGIQAKLQNNFYLAPQTVANGDVESFLQSIIRGCLTSRLRVHKCIINVSCPV